jgi:protein O-mannosyl-transferase
MLVNSGKSSSRFVAFALAMLVAAVTFIAYIPALSNQFLLWDDDLNFTTNPHYRGLDWLHVKWMFTAFHAGHYQPIAWLTLGWDAMWGQRAFGEHPVWGAGMDPRAYHFTNNLLHAINASLVYLVALRLIGWGLLRDPLARSWAIHIAAGAAALLWSVHPMRVENVAWITERRDLVSAMLLLSTVLAYLRAAHLPDPRRWQWIAISCALYALSLMAKVSGVPLVIAWIALDWFPLRRLKGNDRHTSGSIWLEKLPYLVIALTFAYIATTGQAANNWLFPYSHHPLDARILQMCYGLMSYVQKTIAPFNLLPLYELHIPMNKSEPRFTIAVMIVVAVAVALLLLLLKRKWPGVVVATICYAAFLGPVLGLFQNGPQIVADRYSYLPAIGLMIALAGGALWVLSKGNARKMFRTASLVLTMVIVAALGVLTWRQCYVWRTTESMWEFTLARDDHSAVANNGYGLALLHAGRPAAEAVPYLRRAVEIDPLSKRYRTNLREAMREADMMRELLEQWVDEARFGEFNAAWHAAAGNQAMQASDNRLALEHFTVSLMLNENQPHIHNNLALVLARLNRADDAINHYRRAIALDPNLPHPRYGLAVELSKKGQTQEAIQELGTLLKLKPDHANGATLLQQLRGRPPAGPQ